MTGARHRAEEIRRLKAPEFDADGLVFGYGYTPQASEQTPDWSVYCPIHASGNRLPHELIDGRPLLDLLGPDFTVIGTDAEAEPLLGAARSAGVPVAHVRREGPPLLVRPDQHIAWTARSPPTGRARSSDWWCTPYPAFRALRGEVSGCVVA